MNTILQINRLFEDRFNKIIDYASTLSGLDASLSASEYFFSLRK